MAEEYCPKTREPIADSPKCEFEAPGYCGVEPLPIMGRTIEPHRLAICKKCHAESYKRVYGVAPK